MTEKWYKVLTSDLQSAHGGAFDWSGYVGQPTKRTPARKKVAICESGYHATIDPMRWAIVGMRVFEAVVDGDPIETQEDKGVWPTMGLGLERPELVPSWWHDVEAFVTELPTWPWMQPQGDPDPSWKVFPTSAEARDAARDAERNAKRDVTLDVVDAVLDAKHCTAVNMACHASWDVAGNVARDLAWAAARDAARDAAGDAAWDEAWDVARAAICDASWDAALWAQVLVCSGLPLAQRHIEHARARMEVWRRGYGLLGALDGVLYVYERP